MVNDVAVYVIPNQLVIYLANVTRYRNARDLVRNVTKYFRHKRKNE